MKSAGVIVARFQTPFLHQGHHSLVKQVKEKHNKVIIILGVSPVKLTPHNPFDFYTREKMIKETYPELIVLPLADNPSDDYWSHQLDAMLANAFPSETFVLYGSRDCFITSYHGRHVTEELLPEGDFSATELREKHSDDVLSSKEFRLGINYAAHNRFPIAYATVDIAVLNESSTAILLGKKPNTTQWRFPGGFVDPADKSLEGAAKRELTEECGAFETGAFKYLGSRRVNDWRYKNEIDKIITTLFATTFVYGKPEAGDDLAEVKWFNVAELPALMTAGQVASEHTALVNMLLSTLIK